MPRSASAGANDASRASRMPFVFRTTCRIGLERASASSSRIRGWIDGSPPENITTSGSPSARTNASSARSTWSSVSVNPSGWWPESAKQMGQSRLHAEFTSITPRQACCLWSGHSPQSSGHPSRTSVCVSSGIVPGLLNRIASTYIVASPYTRASKAPCSGHRFRRKTWSSRAFTSASSTRLQTGQMLLVTSRNTSSRSTLSLACTRPLLVLRATERTPGTAIDSLRAWVRNRLVWPGVRNGVDVGALPRFRAMKDEFFATDPSSPLTPPQRARFRGLAYFPPNPELAVEAELHGYVTPNEVDLVTSCGDTERYRRAGVARFEVAGVLAAITLFRSLAGSSSFGSATRPRAPRPT